MGARRIWRPWDSQPQEAAPIAAEWRRGLHSVLLPSIGLRDYSGEQWTTWGTAPTRSGDRHGVCIDTTGAFGGLMLSPAANSATASQTHLFVVETTAVSGDYAGLFSVASADGSSNSLSFQRDNTGRWAVWGGGSNANLDMSYAAAFGPSVLIVTGDASGSAAYLDGVQVLAGGSAPASQGNSRIVLFGERAASASYATKGKCYLRAGWTRGLSAAEIADISGNPWRLFAPREMRIWKPSAAAVPNITAVYADSVTTSSVTPRVTLDFA